MKTSKILYPLDLEDEFPDLEYCNGIGFFGDWNPGECAEKYELPDGRIAEICPYPNREFIEKHGWKLIESEA